MATSPILTNIIKRGVVPVLDPIDQALPTDEPIPIINEPDKEKIKESHVGASETLSFDEIEQRVDERLQQLKIDLMNDLKQTIQNKD